MILTSSLERVWNASLSFSMFLSLNKSLKWAYSFGWYVASNDWSEVLLIVFSTRLLIWWSFWMTLNFQVDLFCEKFASAFFCNRVISFEQHLIVKGDNFVQRTSGHTIVENNSIAVVLEERAILVLRHLQVEVINAMLIGSVTVLVFRFPLRIKTFQNQYG